MFLRVGDVRILDCDLEGAHGVLFRQMIEIVVIFCLLYFCFQTSHDLIDK